MNLPQCWVKIKKIKPRPLGPKKPEKCTAMFFLLKCEQDYIQLSKNELTTVSLQVKFEKNKKTPFSVGLSLSFAPTPTYSLVIFFHNTVFCY